MTSARLCGVKAVAMPFMTPQTLSAIVVVKLLVDRGPVLPTRVGIRFELADTPLAVARRTIESDEFAALPVARQNHAVKFWRP
jgi:hypothetical protein